ncbi:arginine biosynthesis bifunctional protein ArgJ [Melioribacter roseus P3M-2]|uniref:Arginine biosynthesis bifunctional protein ArgJ n=1 Tax=Melioribacter roseus (strain DSM 23840 / JCM 17771 / VKM B-2668 / P3M-2) TaxID=1191523 RepID=I7A2K2_MELRP|nr:bifunctional glutamate N-acetyltransferase/amino-acid acetyltransferase ArgJ [Melioribacter roseus]AFN74161.1 arginine biosynthesis bifunctional protein ArgJ [Melioribacter roseus P3M-2]
MNENKHTEIISDKEMKSGITAPMGFLSAGLHCGIKRYKKDLALIVSETPATAAAIFTKNKVQAAPVLISKKHLNSNDKFRAIIVNSGNANACTGEQGMKDAVEMAALTASALNIKPEEVFVSSTGVIGEPLPMEKIRAGIGKIVDMLSEDDSNAAAEAIMTTDTFPKFTSVEFEANGKIATIGGIAKGSGMIHPNMATMLAFITTDAAVEKNYFQNVLKKTADKTFNRITVDGDTSTNDMVIALANGVSGAEINDDSSAAFETALFELMKKLAIDIVKDGEGATKLIEIVVEGALSDDDALKAARSVAHSPLVKTAVHGEDANWGRILAAVGYSGIEFNPDDFEIYINGTCILGKNYDVKLSIEEANKTLKPNEIELLIKLNEGSGKANYWTCDLSEEYVKINGSYRT